ncbi:hypothetical protein ACJ5NV_02085 [Loktanella agnita]|uniref:hypothetical protein n=1 Tax=Loktanella agnita TaxID=287097 RepID=UPI0039858EEA
MIEDKLPPIRQWADVQALINADKLTPAEHRLIAAAKAGEIAEIGEAVPKIKTPETLIRAPLLRYLILGGCKDCRTEAAGVLVQGAWMADTLDLSFSTAKGALFLFNCNITEELVMLQSTLAGLLLKGSTLRGGLGAQGAQISGDVFLRSIQSEGEVNLSGAAISGQLVCDWARLQNADGYALDAQGAHIGGGVFLSDVQSEGEVCLSGTAISGELDCTGASLHNADGKALNAQRMKVEGSFLWRDVKVAEGAIDLASAHVADLVDDMESWTKCDELSLVGFTYDVLHGTTDAAERLDWLQKGAISGGKFHPQPYEQLAKTLREGGHRAEAREIMVAQEQEQRAYLRRQRNRKLGWFRALPFNSFLIFVDLIFRWSLGYGYKPERIAYSSLPVLIIIGWFLAYQAWHAGDFAPNSPVILESADWQSFATDRETYPNPAAAWGEKYAQGQDFETFHSLAYAVDVVIPIISLGQEAAWAPSTNRGGWGWHLWWVRWILITLGWIVTAIGAAAVTGVIRRD